MACVGCEFLLNKFETLLDQINKLIEGPRKMLKAAAKFLETMEDIGEDYLNSVLDALDPNLPNLGSASDMSDSLSKLLA